MERFHKKAGLPLGILSTFLVIVAGICSSRGCWTIGSPGVSWIGRQLVMLLDLLQRRLRPLIERIVVVHRYMAGQRLLSTWGCGTADFVALECPSQEETIATVFPCYVPIRESKQRIL